MKYLFNTTTTMKEYNHKKWWVDRDLVPSVRIEAKDLKEALIKFREHAEKSSSVEISKNALEKKVPMYRDINDEPVQVGYTITGSTYFDGEYRGWTKQYVELWVEIIEIKYPTF